MDVFEFFATAITTEIDCMSTILTPKKIKLDKSVLKVNNRWNDLPFF